MLKLLAFQGHCLGPNSLGDQFDTKLPKILEFDGSMKERIQVSHNIKENLDFRESNLTFCLLIRRSLPGCNFVVSGRIIANPVI